MLVDSGVEKKKVNFLGVFERRNGGNGGLRGRVVAINNK